MKNTKNEIEKYVKAIRRRNITEICVGFFMLIFFSRQVMSSTFGSIEYFGHLLIIIGLIFIMGMIVFVATTRSSFKHHPPEDFTYWYGEMLRQARLLRLVPLWYVAPFLPGFTLLLWPLIPVFMKAENYIVRIVVILPLVVIISVLYLIVSLNLKASRKLQLKAEMIKLSSLE